MNPVLESTRVRAGGSPASGQRASPKVRVAKAVELRRVSRIYRGARTPAIDAVSFEADEGSFTALIGDSSSGKSTMLNQISLLDRPTSGEVYLWGQRVSDLSESERKILRGQNIGLVFQRSYLLPSKTVRENVVLPLEVAGINKQRANGSNEKPMSFEEAMSTVGLPAALGDRTPGELSGGEEQRVALARAIVRRPRLLVCDEPTANLDPENKLLVLELLAALNAPPRGATVILVTHNPELALQFADRILVLSAGRLVLDEARGSDGFAPDLAERVARAFRPRKKEPR